METPRSGPDRLISAVRCGASAGDTDPGAPGRPASSDLESHVSGTVASSSPRPAVHSGPLCLPLPGIDILGRRGRRWGGGRCSRVGEGRHGMRQAKRGRVWQPRRRRPPRVSSALCPWPCLSLVIARGWTCSPGPPRIRKTVCGPEPALNGSRSSMSLSPL